MNFFSTDAFLDALAAARYPGQRCEKTLVSAGGQVFRVLSVDGQAVTRATFLDLLEPVPGADPASARALGWIPTGLRGIVSLDEWRASGAPPECEPCPTVLWREFPSWEMMAARFPRPSDARRQLKKLESQVGPVRYVGDDPDLAVLRRCLEWKSAQYQATGFVDLFADRRNVALMEALHDAGALVVSSLYTGDRLAAVHVGMRHEGRSMSWIPAYDRDLHSYSPGRMLLHHILEDSYGRGDSEFDFLIGDEEYKYVYATHVRIAGPVGTPPLKVRGRKAAKAVARAALRGTGLLDRAKQLKRWLRERGYR